MTFVPMPLDRLRAFCYCSFAVSAKTDRALQDALAEHERWHDATDFLDDGRLQIWKRVCDTWTPT